MKKSTIIFFSAVVIIIAVGSFITGMLWERKHSKPVKIRGITVLLDQQQVEWAEYILAEPYGWQQKKRAYELYKKYGAKSIPALLEVARLRGACDLISTNTPVNRRTNYDIVLGSDLLSYLEGISIISHKGATVSPEALMPFFVSSNPVQMYARRFANKDEKFDRWMDVGLTLSRINKGNDVTNKILKEYYSQNEENNNNPVGHHPRRLKKMSEIISCSQLIGQKISTENLMKFEFYKLKNPDQEQGKYFYADAVNLAEFCESFGLSLDSIQSMSSSPKGGENEVIVTDKFNVYIKRIYPDKADIRLFYKQ